MSTIKSFDKFKESDLALVTPDDIINEIGFKLFGYYKPKVDMTNEDLDHISMYIISLDLGKNKSITELDSLKLYNLTSLILNYKSQITISRLTNLTSLF